MQQLVVKKAMSEEGGLNTKKESQENNLKGKSKASILGFGN